MTYTFFSPGIVGNGSYEAERNGVNMSPKTIHSTGKAIVCARVSLPLSLHPPSSRQSLSLSLFLLLSRSLFLLLSSPLHSSPSVPLSLPPSPLLVFIQCVLHFLGSFDDNPGGIASAYQHNESAEALSRGNGHENHGAQFSQQSPINLQARSKIDQLLNKHQHHSDSLMETADFLQVSDRLVCTMIES